MHTLKLERFHCIEDSEESGFTSPVFLTVIADFDAASVRALLSPRARWTHKRDKAEAWPAEQTVRSGEAPAHGQLVSLVAMLEGTALIAPAAIEAALQRRLCELRRDRLRGDSPQAAAALVNALLLALAPAPALGNAEPPAVRLLPLQGRAALLPPLSLPGRTGIYKVWFRETV